MGTPHKHAELIKAWADGAEIEVFVDGRWLICPSPIWDLSADYRIRLEPKPDVVLYAAIAADPELTTFFNCDKDKSHNLKLTFDGETGKLKSAEVIA